MALSYDEFIEKFPKDTVFVKRLNDKFHHFNFTYKLGLNVDKLAFKPYGTCKDGGLYFTTLNNVHMYKHYGQNIAVLELCPDAQFYVDPNGFKYKTTKFIIKEIYSVNGTNFENVPKHILEIIFKENDNALNHINNPTEEIYRMAFAQNCRSLSRITQTPELCKLAIKENIWSLRFVREQTLEICKLAIQLNPCVIQCVKNKTPELWKYAIQCDISVLHFIDNEKMTFFDLKKNI
jgi:hypothetical protein